MLDLPLDVLDRCVVLQVHLRVAGDAGPHALQGTRTLLHKEVLRFWKVGFQTVAAPVLTAALYLLIFGHVLSDKLQVFDNVGYTRFLIPGLVMMSVLQNAFANSSSSLIQSKVTGNLVFLLLSPLSHWAWFVAYLGAHPSLAIGPLLETHQHDIGDILRESLEHERTALAVYKELLSLVNDKFVMLEEYARRMIAAEEMHQGDVDKMLRRPGAVEAFSETKAV